MNRRHFVATVGALAAGGGAALGTGAFSSVEAERDVGVAVADDASAYLGVQPTDEPNGNYVDTTSNDALAINLTGDNDNIGDGLAGGEGINTNALTSIADVFQIQNQGTQEIEAAVSPLAFGDLESSLFNFEGVLAVLLVPQNPDEIEVDLDWQFQLPGFSITMIGIKDLSPGDTLQFGLLAMAVPESAIGNVEVSDEFVITGEALQ